MSAELVRLEPAPDLVDRVYRALLDAVCNGTLAPGQRITQEAIAEQLAVSRQPVLQALRLLKQDGLVADAPGRGLMVAPLDAGTTLHVYQVRGALDALAARLAAATRTQEPLRSVAAGRKAARGRDVAALLAADVAFHQSIYAASANPLIEQSAQLHWRHLRRVMGAVLLHAPQRASIWSEHEAIAQAIAAGDAARAESLALAHAQQACTHLLARLADTSAAHSPLKDHA
jgi:DNA-binding GntR family transcriptional regulator